jgi:asparagine synthase (glutamine-hydrolysing)
MIISHPYQFCGYYGYAKDADLTILFNRILSNKNIVHKLGFQYGDYVANVVYISQVNQELKNFIIYPENEDEKIIASLSASGFHDQPDAWVKVKNNSLILGREPFGKVPLYWLKQEDVIWFASHFQLLLPLLKKPEINIAALYGYSCFSYIPNPLSPVKEIFAVPAGTELIWQEKPLQSSSKRLLEWQEAPVLLQNENEATFQLQKLLKQAINRQIKDITSENVGVFLSGGIDSSIVAALLVQAGIKVTAYALDFESILPNPNLSELIYAQKVADFLGIPLVKVPVTVESIKKAIAPTTLALDLPFGDGAPLPLFLLSQVASQETNIIFNGENGDQLFAGWTNKPLIAASIYHQEHPEGKKDFVHHYLNTFHALYGYESQIYQPDIYQQIQMINPQDWLENALDSSFTNNILARLRRASLMLKGAQNIQPRANNLALSQGLWVRSPFTDLALTKWSFQLPGEFCLQGACEKYILKKAVESWLPSEVVWREKQGMAVPVTTLCLNMLRSPVRNWLSPSRLKKQGIWQPQIANQIIRGELGGHIRGGKVGRILWLLMMWQVWQSTVLGEKDVNNFTSEIGSFFYDLYYFPPWGK